MNSIFSQAYIGGASSAMLWLDFGEKFYATQHQLWEHRACSPNSHYWNLIAINSTIIIGLATHFIHDPTCVYYTL